MISSLIFVLIFFLWLSAEIVYARFVDNIVEVSEYNYPRIYRLAEEVRIDLGLKRKVSIFVFEQSNFNAWVMRLFRRRAILLQSEVLETGVTDNEVRYLIGRFVGYLRVQQDMGWFGRLLRITEYSGIFTLFVLPYSRAMVYTGDRLGLAAINGDIGAALSVFQKLLVGRQLGYSVNPLGIVDQRRRSKGQIFAFLARFTSAFPPTTARYVDLMVFTKRTYPNQYRDFAATTSGLPDNLQAISSEKPGSNWAVGLMTLVIILFTVIAWGFALAVAFP